MKIVRHKFDKSLISIRFVCIMYNTWYYISFVSLIWILCWKNLEICFKTSGISLIDVLWKFKFLNSTQILLKMKNILGILRKYRRLLIFILIYITPSCSVRSRFQKKNYDSCSYSYHSSLWKKPLKIPKLKQNKTMKDCFLLK